MASRPSSRVYLFGAGLLLVAGCSSGDSGNNQTCAPPYLKCQTGCINPASDPNNCGYCGLRCPSGRCELSRCVTGSTPSGCDPTKPNACNDTVSYCDPARVCQPCPRGSFNCDGIASNACECQSGCLGTACKPAQSGGCNDAQYPNPADPSQCLACPNDAFNCDKTQPDCECANAAGCSGTTCKPKSSTSSCNDAQYPDPANVTQCLPCPAGSFNCDKTQPNCECIEVSGCDGTQCRPKIAGCNDVQYLFQGNCVDCPPGAYNCDNNVFGCECIDAAGCNGTVCKPKTCASTQQMVSGSCVACPSGDYNCDDGIAGCECTAALGALGCNGKACKEQELCDQDHQETAEGTCSPCATGTYNCNKLVPGCECTGKGCDDAGCITDCPDNQYRSWDGTCADCPTSTLDCDSKEGCECEVAYGGYCWQEACTYSI